MKKLLLSISIISLSLGLTAQTYVNINATGTNDGTSWANAYTDLHDATYNTTSGEIWVAQGTYIPSRTLLGATSLNLKEYTFRVQFNVQVYGGFDGTETALNQRDWENNPTILSGDVAVGIKVYNIVRFTGNDNTTFLDGFTITESLANAPGFLDGGGIYMTNNSSPIVRNCTFTNNSARFGGAITANTGSPKILNCKFINNTTYQYDGAAIWIEGANGTEIANCLFDSNTAQRKAGAIYIAHVTSTQLSNNTFVNNQTVLDNYSAILVVGVNSATTVSVDNCVFYNNTAGGPSPYAVAYFSNVTLSVENCFFEEGALDFFSTSQANIVSGDPLFTDYPNSDYTLQCASPCVNSGDASGLNIPSTDLNGDNRIISAVIDMGAYENTVTQISVEANFTTICPGETVVLNGLCDGGGFTWDNGVMDGVPFIPTTTQTYTCTGVSSGTTAQITVTIVDIIDETISAQPAVCNGGSTTVNMASSVADVEYVLKDGLGNTVDGPITGTGSSLSFNTGAISTTTTFNVEGTFTPDQDNHALDFDGINDKIETNYLQQASGTFTIEAWIFPRPAAYKRILSNYRGNGSANAGDIIIDTYDAAAPGTSLRAIFGGSGNVQSIHSAFNVLTLNAWNHIAVTFENGTVIFYVDGVQVGSSSTAPFTFVPSATATFHIGEDNPTGGASDYYNGKIDEIRMWSTTRTPAEIAANKDKCLLGSETGLELYYDFETVSGITVLDKTGNNNGTLSNMDYTTDYEVRSDDFTCALSCSVVMSQTATINIATPYNLTETETVCSGESFTFPDGTTQNNITSQVVYTSSLSTVSTSCDSIIETTVNVNPTYNLTETATVCSGENFTFPDGTTQSNITSQAIYTSNLFTVGTSCDSIIETTVDVTVVDANATLTGNTISANQSGADYQWVDCDNSNAPISGEMAQDFTPTGSGNYAVEVTVGNCTETSGCTNLIITGIREASAINVRIFPVPTSNLLNIVSNQQLDEVLVYTINGKLLRTFTQNTQTIDVSGLANGMYLLVTRSEKGVSQSRFIKE